MNKLWERLESGEAKMEGLGGGGEGAEAHLQSTLLYHGVVRRIRSARKPAARAQRTNAVAPGEGERPPALSVRAPEAPPPERRDV